MHLTKKPRFSSKRLRKICRGVATPKTLQRFYLFSGCDSSIALNLEQVTEHIFVRKKLKNYFMCKSNVIRTLHLFYRHNTTCKNIDTETESINLFSRITEILKMFIRKIPRRGWTIPGASWFCNLDSLSFVSKYLIKYIPELLFPRNFFLGQKSF